MKTHSIHSEAFLEEMSNRKEEILDELTEIRLLEQLAELELTILAKKEEKLNKQLERIENLLKL